VHLHGYLLAIRIPVGNQTGSPKKLTVHPERVGTQIGKYQSFLLLAGNAGYPVEGSSKSQLFSGRRTSGVGQSNILQTDPKGICLSPRKETSNANLLSGIRNTKPADFERTGGENQSSRIDMPSDIVKHQIGRTTFQKYPRLILQIIASEEKIPDH